MERFSADLPDVYLLLALNPYVALKSEIVPLWVFQSIIWFLQVAH